MNGSEIKVDIQQELFALQDLSYRDFHAKLMPTVDKARVIGVRTPKLRAFAKEFGKTEEAKEFLKVLPHQYYEENNLHGLLIEQIKDYPTLIDLVNILENFRKGEKSKTECSCDGDCGDDCTCKEKPESQEAPAAELASMSEEEFAASVHETRKYLKDRSSSRLLESLIPRTVHKTWVTFPD